MPTGYTARVQEGTVTELREYAAACARAFGAFIHMRDDDNTALLRKPQPDKFAANWVLETASRVKHWINLDEESRYAEWSNYYRTNVATTLQLTAKSALYRSRYTEMLSQIVPLDVPSELIEFKEFMVSQLTKSVESDCHENPLSTTPMDFYQWCDDHEAYLRRSYQDAMKRAVEAEKRYAEQIDYINLMADTFGFEVE